MTPALDRDGTPGFADKVIFEQLVYRFGNLELASDTVGLHPASYIHRILPKIVNKFAASDYSSYHRSS